MGKASCHEFVGHEFIRAGNFEICILTIKHINMEWIRTEQSPFCKQSSRDPKQYYRYVTIIHVSIQNLNYVQEFLKTPYKCHKLIRLTPTKFFLQKMRIFYNYSLSIKYHFSSTAQSLDIHAY